MEYLAEGTYTVLLTAFSSGGNWALTVYCTTLMPTAPTYEPTANPTNEFHGQFIVGDSYMTFSDAEDWCNSQGVHLASIHSDEEHAAAFAVCTDCWIGLHCIGNTQFDFEWTDGTIWNYENWDSDQPNNWQNTNQDCVHMWSLGKWNDNGCTQTFRPLCNDNAARNYTAAPTMNPTMSPSMSPPCSCCTATFCE